MKEKIKIAVIGLVHDHVWSILNQFKIIENAEVTCAADVNEPLLEKVRELGIKKTYRCYEDLLAKEKIDAVIVYSENSRHVNVTEAAAEMGLHVMVEKPMAANLEQAQRMYDIAKRSSIRLMINFPTAWNPEIKHAYQLAREGLIGRVKFDIGLLMRDLKRSAAPHTSTSGYTTET